MSRIVKLIIGILIISLTQFCSSGLAKVRYFSVSDIKQPIVGSYTNLGIFTDKVCEPLNPKDKEVTPLSVVFLVFKIVYWPFTLIYYAFDNALKKSEDLTIKYT
ncbi:MAG: hypothetical protein JJT78_07185, partial [Leptospira sp.]|nr:hypothetical protein [Leptospira sp.]